MIEADGRRLWRVLENLYNNAFKYALEGTRVYVTIEDHGADVVFTIKNVSANPLNISRMSSPSDSSAVTFPEHGGKRTWTFHRERPDNSSGGKFELIIDGDLFKGADHVSDQKLNSFL